MKRGKNAESILAALALWGLLAAGATPDCEAQEPVRDLRLLEAVEMTLVRDPNIALVRSQTELFRGALVRAAGRFDPLLGMDLSRVESEGPGDSEDDVAILGAASFSQELRTGLVLEPAIDLSRTGDGGSVADNQATVSFAIRQPLLRGRGRAVVTAVERSAEEELDASRLGLRHAVSARLAAVTTQYWIVAAAALDLEVLRTTEDSSRDLLETTRRLIAADLTPAAELVQLEADLAAQEATRIAGEQALFAARQDLGREIGLEAEEILALPLPSDPFPTVDPEAVPDGEEALRFLGEALARRDDLRAAERRIEASRVLLTAARNALRPRLDLLFAPSYSSEIAGDDPGDFFSPLFRDIPGVSTLVGLSLSLPVRNLEAEGALIQSEAAADLAALEAERLAKEIGAEIPAALDAVARSALQVERAAEALRLFEEAVENEERKLQAGTSTLIDLISQRDRLTAARQRWVRAQLALALALVDLRFETGTLAANDGEDGTVRLEDLTTIPVFGPP